MEINNKHHIFHRHSLDDHSQPNKKPRRGSITGFDDMSSVGHNTTPQVLRHQDTNTILHFYSIRKFSRQYVSHSIQQAPLYDLEELKLSTDSILLGVKRKWIDDDWIHRNPIPLIQILSDTYDEVVALKNARRGRDLIGFSLPCWHSNSNISNSFLSLTIRSSEHTSW